MLLTQSATTSAVKIPKESINRPGTPIHDAHTACLRVTLDVLKHAAWASCIGVPGLLMKVLSCNQTVLNK